MQNIPLSGFLSSSLNVELVYILLESITTFSKLTSQQRRTGIITQKRNEAALGNKLEDAFVTPLDESKNLVGQVMEQKDIYRVLTLHEV